MDSSVPIWEVPSVKEKVNKVNIFITGMLYKRNLFGWREFIEDLKTEVAVEIYKYEKEHLAGTPGYEKEQGVGAYCNMACQGAANWVAHCMAHKRRINYETSSLDALIETEKGAITKQLGSTDENEFEKMDLLLSIEQQFGDQIRELAERVLNGGSLSKEDLQQLRKVKKLKEFLRGDLK